VIMTTKGPSSVALAGTENGHGSNDAPPGAPLPGPGAGSGGG